MPCCPPPSNKKHRKRKRRVHRRSEPRSAPADDFLADDTLEKVLVEDNPDTDQPLQNIIEPIPSPQQNLGEIKYRDSVSYSKRSNPRVQKTSPQSDRASLEKVKAIEIIEEKSEILAHHSPEQTQKVVNLKDQYPERKISVKKPQEYKSLMPKQVKKTGPHKISVNIQILGRGRLISIPTKNTDTVFELRFKIFDRTRILPTNQILVHQSRELPLQKQLLECGIEDHSEIDVTDQGKDITEYIIEVTDAKTVRKLKSELEKLKIALLEAKNMSTAKLRQNDWSHASRLVENARALEEEKAQKEQELKEIHKRHMKGFRQLHVKIMMLLAEKRKSAAEYSNIKRDLIIAAQKNEVVRVRRIAEKLMIQFVRHDGCERELLLLESVVPDMVNAARDSTNVEDVNEKSAETSKKPPFQDVYQYQQSETYKSGDLGRVKSRGQTADVDGRLYTTNRGYQQPTTYNEQFVPVATRYYEPQPQPYDQYGQQNVPGLRYVSGGAGDAGAYYN